MFGLLNLSKSIGPTSHDMVAAVRRRAGRGVKVGHAGTLDPFADGVLVVCLGSATKLADFVQQRPKKYRATIRFGETSTTDDVEGDRTPTANAQPVSEADLRAALPTFTGTIQQAPPAHSAIHVDGQRAYQLARAGQAVDLPRRPVTIYALDLVKYEWPTAVLDVHCAAGTYIRSLARDLGQTLGVGGYCHALTRTAVGPFTLDQAISPEQVALPDDLLPPAMLFADAPRARLDEVQLELIRRGRALDAARVEFLPPPPDDGPIALLDTAGKLVGLAELRENRQALQPRKVFAF